jgi:hypothetical protein
VILDGEDIASRCYRAELEDDGTLTAFCYAQSPDGKYCIHAGEVLKEKIVGRGEIR